MQHNLTTVNFFLCQCQNS